MEEVQKMMVHNTSSNIRNICAGIFVQFLIDYPLSPTRVESHIHFVIQNLECKITDGRLQILDILNTLLEKLPGEVINLYCELIFFSLLLRSVNDINTKCRVAA
jgi:hypothetical protein